MGGYHERCSEQTSTFSLEKLANMIAQDTIVDDAIDVNHQKYLCQKDMH